MGWWTKSRRPDDRPEQPRARGSRDVDAELVERPGPRSRLPRPLPRHRPFDERRAWGGH